VGTPIRLCAIRVEFQEDSVTGTSGSGLMGSGLPDTIRIDPLPHDKRYFEDHLQFLSNYYGTVSKGAVSFSALDVFPQADNAAYRLDYPMWHYNFNTADDLLDQRLVELFVQSLWKADSIDQVDFDNYDAVLIFHAGVGKDFNIGYDNTPFDIPSAYISEQDLERYDGQIPSGVTRGLILPESQNQSEVLDFGVELSINGVMVKLFGNWLGLPDLFDTKTGASAIGRWGMMDQGSGNVNALVPAMPDIWSRIYMSWQEPVSVVPPGIIDTLRLARFEIEGAPEAIKIPVTPREYYLLENRDADADSVKYVTVYDRDGLEMRIDQEGDITYETGFKVAVRADHYDFGIPGSGILIWHIDENVIEEGLEENSVNTDPKHRGVDLVEADGSQDIGEEFGFATAGSGTELGIQEDAWYRDNRNHRDANGGVIIVRFNDNTRPSAKLYDKSFTYIELSNFSNVDSIMSFTIRSTMTAAGFPIEIPNSAEYLIADVDGDGYSNLLVHNQDSLFIFDSLGTQIYTTPIPQDISFASAMPAVDVDGNGAEEVLFEGLGIGLLRFNSSVYEFHSEAISYPPEQPLRARVRPAISSIGNARIIVFVGSVDSELLWGNATLYDLDLNLIRSIVIGQEEPIRDLWNLNSYPARHFLFATESHLYAYSVEDSTLSENWSRSDLTDVESVRILHEPNRNSIYIDGYGYIDAATGEDLCLIPDCIAPEIDWDGDGIPDGGGLAGRHVVEREDAPQISTEIQNIIDLDADGKPDILGFEQPIYTLSNQDYYSRIQAFDHDGPRFGGFPVATSGTPDRTLFSWGSSNSLFYTTRTMIDTVSYLSVQRLPIQSLNSERFAYTEPDAIINIGEPKPQVHDRSDWIYCWPNPTPDISHIHLTAPSAATATIQLYDIAGRKVTELRGASSQAGQFEIDWNVSGIQSGVYIGRAKLEAGGKTQTAEIKIAVVK
jgi:M6 family metalloprotease-like protein